jgi:branched-chain amino acid transport system permease protein
VSRSGAATDLPPGLRRVLRLAVLAAILTPPLLLDGAWLRVGAYAMIGAVGAIGLTLLIGQAGQLSLAHAFFLLAGGTAYCVLAGDAATDGGRDLVGLGLPPLVAAAGAVVVTAALGLVFAPVAGRVRGIYLGVASLALIYVGLYVGQEFSSISGGTASGRSPADLEVFGFSFVRNDPELTVLGVPMGREERMWYLFAAVLAGAYLLAQGAVRSRPGRSWRAIRDNEHAAAALGVPVRRVRAGVFAVSSAYAGMAGVMTVVWFDLLKPDENEFVGTYSIEVSIAYLAMVIIGGLGSVPGAVAGALLVQGLPKALELTAGRSGLFGGDVGASAITPVVFTSFVFGVAIILVVLFEPGGLAALGRRITGAISAGAPPTPATPEKGH